MPGGECLNEPALKKLWQALQVWTGEQVKQRGSLAAFLTEHAPQWHQVGNVFFHLGENKLDNRHPFAFMVTCATDVNAKGELKHAPLAHAIKHYANNRQALTRLMEPIARAAAQIPWLDKLCNSGAIYRPTPWTADEAYQFLLAAPALEQYGIGARLPDWWKKRARPRVLTEISTRKESQLGIKALLDFDIQLALGDEALDEATIDALLARNAKGLMLVKNQWVEVDSEKLGEALAHWQSIKAAAKRGELTFQQGMRLLAGLCPTGTGLDMEAEISQWSTLRPGKRFRELLDEARALTLPAKIPALRGQLRHYQEEGVAWLNFLTNLGLGACLADDMGLGKTVQIISLLLLAKARGAIKALLVAPASLITNWQAECAKFAPTLRVLALHPSQCKLDNHDQCSLADYDLTITSYAMASRIPWLQEIEWSHVIADEAQNLKNGRTRQSIAVRKLKAEKRIALTGTPIENSAGDLWALFDFLNPGLLGTAKEYDKLLKELQQSPNGLAPLRKLAMPYILRRMKTDKNIIATLPDKTEMPLFCNLAETQARLYQKVVDKMSKDLEKMQERTDDKKARNLLVLQNLVLLKQICNHPAQAGLLDGYAPEKSGKFLCLGELCSAIASRQEKVLIFTQFREIIEPLSQYLADIFGKAGLSLHGGTPVKKRQELVRQFQTEDGPPFFILSLKAGGTGLTLTNASHVIHFDRWWNPAVEDQATDRAYRIGQKQNVLVHKCVTLGTLEEKIDALIMGKRAVAEQILSGVQNNIMAMNDEQILELVRLDSRSIMP